jgi:hypothetical protein
MKTVNQPVFLIYRPVFSVYRSIFLVFIFSRFLKYWIFWIVTDRFSMNRRNWFLQISQKPTRFHRYLNSCLWVDTPRSQERVIKNLKWWLSRSTDHLQCHRCNCRHESRGSHLKWWSLLAVKLHNNVRILLTASGCLQFEYVRDYDLVWINWVFIKSGF